MKKITLIIDFRMYNNVQLLEKSRLIRRNLTPRPVAALAGPEVPFLDDLDNAMEAFRIAIDENIPSSEGSRTNVKMLREELIAILKKIKSYLDIYYIDDPVAMASSGFDIAKDPEPAKEREITGFKLQAISVGTIKLTLDAVPNAKMYFFEYRLENETNWYTVTQSSSRCVLNNLESGKRYYFRVSYAITTRSHFVSQELTSFVL